MEKAHTNKCNLKSEKGSTSPSHSAVSSSSSSSGGMASCQSKSPNREHTKPQEVKLRTQERVTKRAMFNYMVAAKLSILELQRKQEERTHKMMEEEEIRLMRKEMIPRAQLMPFFDRPFIPQRSSRPLTIPKEPKSFRGKCFTCISGTSIYNFRQTTQAPIQ